MNIASACYLVVTFFRNYDPFERLIKPNIRFTALFFFASSHICSSLIAMKLFVCLFWLQNTAHSVVTKNTLIFALSTMFASYILYDDQWSCLLSEICVCKYFWIVHVFVSLQFVSLAKANDHCGGRPARGTAKGI